VDYRNSEEVISDIKEVIEWLLNLKTLFQRCLGRKVRKGKEGFRGIIEKYAQLIIPEGNSAFMRSIILHNTP